MIYSLEICNKALSHCKTKGIASLEEKSFEAEILNKWFESSLLNTLSAINWKFATKFSKLALTEDEVEGWDFVYQLPADFVKMILVNTALNEEYKDNENYTIIGDKVCSSVSGASALYVCSSIQPQQYTPEFSTSFSFCLASNIASELTGSSQFAQSLLEQYRVSIYNARSSNFKQEFKKPERINRYKDARRW